MGAYFKVEWDILEGLNLNSTEVLIYSILKDRYDYHKKPFYCIGSWIAEKLGCTEKTVQTVIKKLQKKNLVKVTKEYDKKLKRVVNLYIVYKKGEVVEDTPNKDVKFNVIKNMIIG